MLPSTLVLQSLVLLSTLVLQSLVLQLEDLLGEASALQSQHFDPLQQTPSPSQASRCWRAVLKARFCKGIP